MKRALVTAALFTSTMAAPAAAQMQTPEWIEDVDWHANLGTGIAVETGGLVPRDPILLYFGMDIRKSWRWWYGLTLSGRADFYTGLTTDPMLPYKLRTPWSLALGPNVFRMEILRADFFTDFGGFTTLRYSSGTNFRIEAATLPTFTGDVPLLEGKHILTYFISPLHVVVGHYARVPFDGVDQLPNAPRYSLVPYTAGKVSIADRIILTPWAQIHGALSLFKGWGRVDGETNREFRLTTELGATIGILQNAVQFGFEVYLFVWQPPLDAIFQTATFTLSARLRI